VRRRVVPRRRLDNVQQQHPRPRPRY
jgi:hypothetical protein